MLMLSLKSLGLNIGLNLKVNKTLSEAEYKEHSSPLSSILVLNIVSKHGIIENLITETTLDWLHTRFLYST